MGEQAQGEGHDEQEGSQWPAGRELKDLLDELSELCGVRLEIVGGGDSSGAASAPVVADGSETGWRVVARGEGPKHERACRLAALVLGAGLSGQARADRPPEAGGHYEQRVEFLYKMSQSVAGLLEEQAICDFVIEEAAQLLGCDRASLMLYDQGNRLLRIRASVGVPGHIAAEAGVRPGERISGKVFQSGREVVVGAEDPPPDESLGVQELRDSPAFLSVPLTVPGDEGAEPQILGVVNLTGRDAADPFTPADLKVVRTVTAHAAAQIHNCRLLEAERERRRLEEQLQIASQIQLSLLPEHPLSAGPLEVAGVCRPAHHVRGDFFDYWEQDGRVCIVVADVSGHDLGAALLASAFRSVVRTFSAGEESAGQLLSRINRAMYADLLRSEMLITLCYLEIRPDTGQLTLCRCGHPYPLLLRGGESTWLTAGGPLLGMEKSAQFEEESLRLLPGDVLVVYTDGVIEAGPPRRRQFGSAGLIGALGRAPRDSASGLAQSVLDDVLRYMDGAEMSDDATVVAIRTTRGKGG